MTLNRIVLEKGTYLRAIVRDLFLRKRRERENRIYDRINHFDPFFTTRGESGTGLGLSLSYSIVKDHGGLLEYRRGIAADGALFRIELPA